MPPAALVTGSSRGIGRAIALELARRGYAVTVNYVARQEAAEEVAREIAALGSQAIAVQGNVARSDDRARLIDSTLAAFGRIDLLVNNAGITSPGRRDLLEATEESWDEVFAINLKGPFFLAQLAARRMSELIRAGMMPGGAIINVSSVSAFAASDNRADYCIAKSAMQMLTWLFAARLAAERIVAFEVCPGVIESDMTAPVKEKYDRLLAEGLAPLGRWGRPEDVARAVAALATGELPYCTGEQVRIDGGYHIRRL